MFIGGSSSLILIFIEDNKCEIKINSSESLSIILDIFFRRIECETESKAFLRSNNATKLDIFLYLLSFNVCKSFYKCT